MSKLILPGGLVVIVTPDPAAYPENRYRAQNNGTRFVPPWHIWAYGDRRLLQKAVKSPLCLGTWRYHADPENWCVLLGAFDWKAEHLQTGFTTAALPYTWAPQPLADARIGAWLWTTDGLVLHTEQETRQAA